MATSTALRSIALEASALRRADLSQGTESCVVRCENTVDGEHYPATPYAAACFSTDSRLSRAVIRGCSCADAQCGTLACSCASSSAYDAHGRLVSFEVPGIFECSERCRCDALCCRNRVVSRGLRVPLVVFKTRTFATTSFPTTSTPPSSAASPNKPLGMTLRKVTECDYLPFCYPTSLAGQY